jgi:hypothetical protein
MSVSLFTDRDLTEKTGKILAFFITVASMTLAFNLIPLLPSPLPIIVAFLVAYTAYRDPPVGAFTGSVIIALGLFYHLSRIGFFQLFHGPWLRVLIMVVLILPFVIVSASLTDNLAVIAMDMGIIASSLLFFKSVFYLAVPVILIFATIYKRRRVIVTFSYYMFISIPLQVMQYLKIYQAGIPPSLYSPLNIIQRDIQESMRQVSLTEINHILRVIGEQLLKPSVNDGALQPALASYVDSLPGMLFFLIIISGLISAAALLTLKLPEPLKKSRLPQRYVDVLVYMLPAAAASFMNVVFFILMGALHTPLAFQADLGLPILIKSTAFTIVLSAPVSLSKYLLDIKEVLGRRIDELKKGSESLLHEVERYLRLIDTIRSPIPSSLSSLKTRMLIVGDELKEVIAKVSVESISLKEVDSLMRRVFTELKDEVTKFHSQLGGGLDEYFIKIKFEYLESIREINELGLKIEAPEIPDPTDPSLGSKIWCIDEVIESGRVLVEELIATSDGIYEIISSLFEPSLPGDSPVLQISREKSEMDEPWVIIDAILSSLKNWERQYSAEIVKSTEPIRKSIETIIELSKQDDILLPIIGDRFNMIKTLAKGLEEKEFKFGDENLKVLKVILVRDTLLATVEVVARVISIFYDQLKNLEKTISSMLPIEDYEWNRNLTLVDRMDTSLGIIKDYASRSMDDIITHLYRVLSYIDEVVNTLEYYNGRREFLLNYRILEKRIDRLLREKDEVQLEDLGVSEKYGREYLKLYHRSHFKEAPLQRTSDSLRRAR